MLYYNRAYIFFSCFLSLDPALALGDTAKTQQALSDCVREPLKEMTASLKLVTDYGPLFLRNPKAMKCELKARLFKAELEFPAYDFLASDKVYLYDHKTLGACLISSVE